MTITVHESVIKLLVGSINGINKTFTTPAKYVAGTLRVVWNGQVYEPDDDNFGWIEIDNETIEMFEAPRVGDVLQAFYNDEASKTTLYDGVKGSPFDPHGILP